MYSIEVLQTEIDFLLKIKDPILKLQVMANK